MAQLYNDSIRCVPSPCIMSVRASLFHTSHAVAPCSQIYTAFVTELKANPARTYAAEIGMMPASSLRQGTPHARVPPDVGTVFALRYKPSVPRPSCSLFLGHVVGGPAGE